VVVVVGRAERRRFSGPEGFHTTCLGSMDQECGASSERCNAISLDLLRRYPACMRVRSAMQLRRLYPQIVLAPASRRKVHATLVQECGATTSVNGGTPVAPVDNPSTS